MQAGLKTVIRNTKPPPVSFKILKKGELCDVYAQGELNQGDTRVSIERIFCQGINIYKLRFSLYRKDTRGNYAMVQQPLDITEEAIVYLFQIAMEQGVFTQVFISALLTIL